MKKTTLNCLCLMVSLALWAQEANEENLEIDLSDVTVVESGAEKVEGEAAEIVEIPDAPIDGVSMDESAEVISSDVRALPDETEIILEIPGRDAVAPGEATLSNEETISVDFPDEDVRTILRNVADLFEKNLVIPDSLQGRTSIKLRDITWEQAFEVVLEPLGFTYIEDRNIIKIKSIEELTKEPVDTTVEVIKYARAGDLKNTIQPLIDAAAGGRVEVDVRSNALVITERPSRMNKIKALIASLDRATEQVMIESKFIEVTNNDIENIGVNWASLSGYDLSAGPITREWTRSREQTEIGTSETVDDSGFNSTDGVTFDQQDNIANTLENLTGTSRIDTAVFSATQFNLILSALKNNNDSKLVANPTVVTMDNQMALIEIVTEIPQVDFNFNPETGTREANGLAEPLQFGTRIEVTPQVNDAGFINLNVVPSVSNQIGIIDTQIGPQPIISRREAKTNVVIKDGFTLAIGGLSQNEETESGSKVPLLGDLPGVGRLFSSKSKDMEQRNLIIFITAKTLNPDGTDYREVVDPRVLNDMGVIPSDVPGYSLPAGDLEALRRLEAIRGELQRSERIGEIRSRIEAAEQLKSQSEAEDSAAE